MPNDRFIYWVEAYYPLSLYYLVPMVKRKRKTPTITKLKKDLDAALSTFIRTKYADWRGYVSCVTCGATKEIKKMQNGHFIPGRHNIIRYDERNCHPQCYHCNIGLKSNPRKYEAFMKRTYGQEVIDELDRLDAQTKTFTPSELEDKIKYYKDELLKLQSH